MHLPSFQPPSLFRLPRHKRFSRHVHPLRHPICQTSPPNQTPVPPSQPSQPHLPPAEASKSPLTSPKFYLPNLLQRPEAVLGILIATAAFLADFTRNLLRLTAAPSPPLLTIDLSITRLRNTLTTSKAALSAADARLDYALSRATSAELALERMSQRKDSLLHAREQAEQAELRLQQLTATLASEREKRERVAHQKGVASEEGARLDDDLQTREKDLSCLREDLDALRGKTEQALDLLKNEEMGLREKVGNSEEQLDVVRKERMAVEKEAMEMANCASDMEERARVASVALEETRRELEEVRVQLAEKVKEEEAVDRDTGGVVDRGVEEVAMRKMLGDLECELGELQRELRARDAVVNEVAVESDELRSLLASRDAEVRLLKSRLESAVVVQEERGGDSSLSDLSLQVIKRNMDAEQLALSAEIAKAELATFEISEEDLDPLDRIKKEMDVEGDFLQAGLRKAETAVELEEHSMLRREGNVDDILKQVESGQEIESGVIADETEAMTVAKVAQNKKATEKEAKPKKRRGRPPKAGGATKASNGDGEEKVKRKRGRPRKA